jgi:hypothetical protein
MRSLLKVIVSGALEEVSTRLKKPAASGSVQNWVRFSETLARSILQLSSPWKATFREVVPLEVVKVAVSDVEEVSVMRRVSTAVARIGCVTSADAIAIPKDTSVEGLKILNEGFVFMGLIGCCFRATHAL